VLDSGDKICLGGVALCLRLLLGLLFRVALGGRLEEVFLLASLRLLVVTPRIFELNFFFSSLAKFGRYPFLFPFPLAKNLDLFQSYSEN
jgi:hypothetical protein